MLLAGDEGLMTHVMLSIMMQSAWNPCMALCHGHWVPPLVMFMSVACCLRVATTQRGDAGM
jgi:hypothetical protein